MAWAVHCPVRMAAESALAVDEAVLRRMYEMLIRSVENRYGKIVYRDLSDMK
jgi:hypothetical protein